MEAAVDSSVAATAAVVAYLVIVLGWAFVVLDYTFVSWNLGHVKPARLHHKHQET